MTTNATLSISLSPPKGLRPSFRWKDGSDLNSSVIIITLYIFIVLNNILNNSFLFKFKYS